MKKTIKKTKGLNLRGNTGWMTYKGLDGKQRWESCDTKLKTEAQEKLEDRKSADRKGELPATKKIKSFAFGELAKEYEIWAKRQRSFKSKRGFIKNPDLRTLPMRFPLLPINLPRRQR